MKDGWDIRPLREVGVQVRGSHLPLRDDECVLWSVPAFASDQPEIVPGTSVKSAKTPVQAGDVLICKINPRINRVWQVAPDPESRVNYASTEWIVVRPGPDVMSAWLVHFLSGPGFREWIVGNVKGATGSHTRAKPTQVMGYPIPVPPLAEQERIVRILDDALTAIDQAKAHTESNLLHLDGLSQVTLDEVIDECCATGVRQAFSDLLTSQPRNGWSPPAANHADNGTPVLTLSSVTGFQFDIDKVKYTSAKTDPAAHYWVRDGDLLMTRSNTPRLVGHVALADGVIEPTIYPDLIMRMRLNETQMLTRYAYFLLQTTRSREYLTSRAGGASQTMSKITKGTVQTMPVLVPSLEKQADAVSTLNHVMQRCRAARVICERKATLLDRLRSATLARAFSGNL